MYLLPGSGCGFSWPSFLGVISPVSMTLSPDKREPGCTIVVPLTTTSSRTLAESTTTRPDIWAFPSMTELDTLANESTTDVPDSSLSATSPRPRTLALSDRVLRTTVRAE